jgi:hypothetical protein
MSAPDDAHAAGPPLGAPSEPRQGDATMSRRSPPVPRLGAAEGVRLDPADHVVCAPASPAVRTLDPPPGYRAGVRRITPNYRTAPGAGTTVVLASSRGTLRAWEITSPGPAPLDFTGDHLYGDVDETLTVTMNDGGADGHLNVDWAPEL